MCSVIFTNTQHLSPQSMAPGAVEVSHVAKVNQSSFPASGAAESSADWRFPRRFAPFDCRLKKLDPAKTCPYHIMWCIQKTWQFDVRKAAKRPLIFHHWNSGVINLKNIFPSWKSLASWIQCPHHALGCFFQGVSLPKTSLSKVKTHLFSGELVAPNFTPECHSFQSWDLVAEGVFDAKQQQNVSCRVLQRIQRHKKNTDLHGNNIPLDHIRSIYQPFTHTQRRGIWISKALKVGRSWVQRSRCVTLERSPLMSGR